MFSSEQMTQDFIRMSKGEKVPKSFYRLPKETSQKSLHLVEPTQQQVV